MSAIVPPEPRVSRTAAAVAGQGRPAARYTYRQDVHELHLIEPECGLRKMAAVRGGEAEFALIEESPLLLLAYRFGEAIGWSVAPFEWPGDAGRERSLPPLGPSPETRALLSVTLAREAGGPVLAARNVTLSLDFTRALNAAIRELAASGVDPAGHRRALDRLGRGRLGGPALVARASVRTMGSD